MPQTPSNAQNNDNDNNNNNNSPAQDEENYFEDQNLAFLPADHPLMTKLQKALQHTLEQDHERAHLQLKEKEAKYKKADREKEDVAVELYEVQQKLAELHISLEQTHQNYNLIQKLRIEAEQRLQVLHEQNETRKTQMDRLDQNVIKTQDELSKLTRTLKQIEDYNEQMKSEVAVTRRTTYRAEENILQQEQAKKHQDFYIDHLTDQKKKFNDQLVILEAQVLSQKDETKAAHDILREAETEMENIIASKKNLLERWQKALLEMQRRDKALQVAREALKVQYELHVRITSEISGVTNETKKEAEISETLSASLGRLKLEEKHIEEEKKKLDHEMQKLNAQIKILQQSLQATEVSAQAVAKDNKKVQDHMNVIEDNIMRIHTQAIKVYEQVINKINEHKTLEKTSANLLKQAQLIEQEMQNKEIEKENAENEIARVHLDMLNTTNQLDMLKKKKRDVSEERNKKEETVATYELEIRQGHDINEKKQAEVGKLNKVHDQIASTVGESSKGPLEAHKNHLSVEVKRMVEHIQHLEKDWIRKQTKLVKYQEQSATSGEEISIMKTKKTILEQKKMRLHAIYEGHEKEIRSIKISLKNLQTEMNKLNDGLSRNQISETKLKNENFHIQSDIVEKLKELEKGNVNLEVDIDALKEEKAELLQNIVEAERQLLLWERKIQLEKEIQEALDPNIGQSELKVLKKEIHRMELRLDEVRKRQEKTIQEMERAVYKRETIQLKYTKNEDTDDKSGKDTKTKISKQIETLKSTLDQTTKNSKDFDKKLKQLQNEINERNLLISETNNTVGSTEEDLKDKFTEIVQKKLERQKGIYEIIKSQTMYKAYESISANRFKMDAPENILRERYEKQKKVNAEIVDVLRDVVDTNPQYADVLRVFTRM